MIYDVKYLHTILLGWEFPRVGIEAIIRNVQTWLNPRKEVRVWDFIKGSGLTQI